MYNFKKVCFLSFFIGFITLKICSSQHNQAKSESIYKINRRLEIPLTTLFFAGDYLGFNYLSNKPSLELDEILKLDVKTIWQFDRIAATQDVSFRDQAQSISDVCLYSSVLMPGLLAFDNTIRKDWLDLVILYSETHAIGSGIYAGTASLFKRSRPFMYNPDIPLADKLMNETRNSFYSGHVSSAASASFFMAKVYSDYHPELGNKKYWLFAAALIPPSLVGYYRVKAMKHFPSDVIVGGILGASAGVLIPHLHKRKNTSGFSYVPFAGNFNGLKIAYTFR